MKNAHLLRWLPRLLLDVHQKYVCVASRQPALHLGIFDQSRRCVFQIKFFLFISFFLLLASSAAIAQESVCFTCHEDIAKDWQQSIHSKNGISCHNCHGGNPKDADNPMDPKDGFVGKPTETGVPEFCGKCHAGVKENYLKSGHSAALIRGGPNCVTCHTAHKQKRASLDLINKELCTQCHTFDRAEKIRNAMLMSESEITNLEHRIDALHAQEYDIDAVKKSLFATRNQFHRLTHVVDVDLILKETTGIQSEIARLKADVKEKEKIEAKRKIYGSIVIVFFLLGALIFWWYRNTILSD